MIDMCKPISMCGIFAREIAEDVMWVGKETANSVGYLTQSAVCITADMCKEVGGLRSVAGAISSTVKALDLFGVPVGAFDAVARTCDSVNKGLGGIHVIHRLNEFATGKAYSTMFYLASRIAFLVKDTLNFIDFMENLGVIAAGTANAGFAKFAEFSGISVTSKSISPTFEYVGWGLDTANNLAAWNEDWQRRGWDSLDLSRGLSLAIDVTKLTAITLANSNNFWLKAIRLGALFGVSAVHIVRTTHRHLTA